MVDGGIERRIRIGDRRRLLPESRFERYVSWCLIKFHFNISEVDV